MKKLLIALQLLLVTMMCFAQSNPDTESGIRFYKAKNYKDALPYFQRAAKAGDPVAMDFLGYMYENGYGVPVNGTIAMNLYRKGEAKGHTPCIVGIGRLYREGIGVTVNHKTAYNYFFKAAELKNYEAEYYVYRCKMEGKGTEQDLPGALAYAERSAFDGYGWLSSAIGDMYYKGVGTEVNYDKALEWYMYWFSHKNEYLFGSDTENDLMLRIAEMLYKGQGTGEKPNFKLWNDKYKIKFYADGETGRACITDALVILEELVLKKNFADAVPLHNTVKNKYQERLAASNKVEAPRLTEAAQKHLNRYPTPRKPAIESAGYGEIRIAFTVTSSGSITNASYKKRVLIPLDEAALQMINRMPAWKPAKKGGFDTDCTVVMGITWFPSRHIRMIGYSVK